jgi:hypothetical protein
MNKRLAKLKNIQEANIAFLNRNTKKPLNEGRLDDDDDEFLDNKFFKNNKLNNTKDINLDNTKDINLDPIDDEDEFLDNKFFKNNKLNNTKDINLDNTKDINLDDTKDINLDPIDITITTKPKSQISLNVLGSSAYVGISVLEAREDEPFLLPRLFNHMETDEFKDIFNLVRDKSSVQKYFNTSDKTIESINKMKKEWINLVNQENEVGVINNYPKVCMYPSNPSRDTQELIKNIFDEIKIERNNFKSEYYLFGKYPTDITRNRKKRDPVQILYLENPSWLDPSETIQFLKTHIKTDKEISNFMKKIILLV